MVPTEMTAVIAGRPGGADTLSCVRRPVPIPGPEEVLIRVAAAGVNQVDMIQRSGRYSPPAGTTDILGVEVSGHIAAVGARTTRYKVGDAVCALVVGGGYAEYVAAPEGQTLPIPAGMDLIHAGGVVETYMTTWSAMFDHGRFAAGETILIHGGASGIGTTAIMLARMTGAAAIYVTAGTDEKCRACEKIGAARAINYRTEDFVAVVRDVTGGRGVDVILDMVTADYVPKNMSLLADDGRLVFIGRQGPLVESPINPTPIMFKRLTITGMSLRGQSVARKSAIARKVEAEAWPWFAAGKIAPVIDSIMPLAEAARAHMRLESGQHFGKVILRVLG